jgi:hypothetical protein
MDSEDNLSEITRFERKYRLSLDQYINVKNSLYPYLRRDKHTSKSPENKYLVRSIYFDTLDYQLLLEKFSGNSLRTKFRIRTYNASPIDNPDIRAEIKIRIANLTLKHSAFISLFDCNSFLNSRHWDNKNNKVLIEFQRQAHRLNLMPKTLVEYRREGFHTIDGNNIRITFDHCIQSASAHHLFPPNILWHPNHEQMIVMEIKHKETLPVWINKIIKNHNLSVVANSKYVLAAQITQPDLVYPAWSSS